MDEGGESASPRTELFQEFREVSERRERKGKKKNGGYGNPRSVCGLQQMHTRRKATETPEVPAKGGAA